MAAPSRIARATAEHLAHFVHSNRERGIQYNSHGNLEPVCYFDSGYRQKKLYDKPQYGYVIFWGGAPIIYMARQISCRDSIARGIKASSRDNYKRCTWRFVYSVGQQSDGGQISRAATYMEGRGKIHDMSSKILCQYLSPEV